MRTFLVCLALLGAAACAPGPATRPVMREAHVPVYSCESTRTRQAQNCRPRSSIPRSYVPRSPAQPAPGAR